MSRWSESLLVVNAAATWFMAGVIWLVQLVQYPGFNLVGRDGFVAFHAAHSTRITYVVGPAMLVELVTSLILAYQPAHQAWLLRAGCLCAIATWIITAVLSVPAHNRLALGFDEAALTQLMASNILRTVVWSLHALLVSAVLVQRISSSSVR